MLSEQLVYAEVKILEQIPLRDYDLYTLACQRKDFLGFDCLSYLAELKPIPILNTQLIQTIVEH